MGFIHISGPDAIYWTESVNEIKVQVDSNSFQLGQLQVIAGYRWCFGYRQSLLLGGGS